MDICRKCGGQIPDNQNVCPNCGALPLTEKTPEKLEFYKGKMIGSVTYRRTNTTVQLTSTELSISQKIKRIFRKERIIEKKVPLMAIKSAKVHTAMDFWDTLYAIIAAVLGLFQPIIFIVTLICLWTGYGKEIIIQIESGDTIKIPLAGAKAETEKLLSICNQKIVD